MDAPAFLELLLDTLQRDEALTLDMRLADVPEWDSLAAMAVLALADRRFGRRLSLADFKTLVTVGDLHALLTR